MSRSLHCLVALLCLFPVAICAQNWAPLNSQEQFNYRVDTGSRITSVIFPDLVTYNGSDSTLHLNRIVTGGPTTRKANQPQFLQRVAEAHAGGLWNFRDTANIALYTQAPQGFAWRLDSVAMVDAVVDSIYSDSIFGVADSVRRMLLSTADTILLSRDHGILQWPQGYGTGIYHRLVGIKGRNLGELMPGFKGFFAYKPGDIMEFEEMFNQCPDPWGFPCQCTYFITHYQLHIDSVRTTGPNKQVFGHGYYNSNSLSPCWPSSSAGNFSRSFTVTDSANHVVNYYPKQLMLLGNNYQFLMTQEIPTPPAYGGGSAAYDRANYSVDQSGRLHLTYGAEANYFYFVQGQYPNMVGFLAEDEMEYVEGIGLWKFSYRNFETSGYFNCIGYYDGQDTIGVLNPPVGIADAHDQKAIHLAPNPSAGMVELSWNSVEMPAGGMLEIFALSGQLVAAEKLPISLGSGRMRVDLSALPVGLYSWRMRADGQRLGSGRVLLAR